MVNQLKKLIIDKYPSLYRYKHLATDDNSYLELTGWKETLKRGYPCRRDGAEVPWMNYQIISLLEERLKSDFTLFEYGSGYSTLFYSRLVKSVTSIEYDKQWYELIRQKSPPNVRIIFVEKDSDGDYCRAINRSGERYDVIVIDGRDRVNCLKQAIERLSDRGVILLDDSKREKYAAALAYAKSRGYSALDFEGLVPGEFTFGKTTVIYTAGNCLNI